MDDPVDPKPSGGFSAKNMDRFKKRLLRTKTIMSWTSTDEEAGSGSQSEEPGRLKKVLTTFDLISLGVGSCCGTGMYVVAGLVAKNVAGPGVMLSFVIAAIASILSGVCYAEFGVRVPKTSGSAYMYSYVTVGEFVAFLIGWNLILEYMIGSAAGASALSACFDALTNHTMSAYLEENVGTVIGKTYPDFLGFFIGISMTVVLAFGVQKSVRFNNILTAVNFIVWVFIVVTGLFYVNGENWTNYGFTPYGASGVFSGAATCFYAFIGFDIIATTGEEAKNPSRSIPIAITSSLVVCLTSYISVSLILTLMIPYYDIHGDSALIDVFVMRGFVAGKWVVAVGAVSALTVSLLGSMFPMPRVIYAMSRDGLLFESLSYIHPKTGTPLVATVLTGTLASIMALCTGLKILVEMMSIGTLLAYTLVAVSVLILRYQPDSLADEHIPMAHRLDIIEESPDSEAGDDVFDDVGNPIPGQKPKKIKDDQSLLASSSSPPTYGSLPFHSELLDSKLAMMKRHGKIWWLRLGFPSDDCVPNERTAKNAIIFVGIASVISLGMCLLMVFAEDHLSAGEWWAVILLLVFISGVVSCIVIIMRQPQNKRTLRFMAPGVPIIPCLAMVFNTYLMLKLPALTWVRLGVWILIGLVLYFSYSMMHSAKERKQRQKEDMEDQKERDAVKGVETADEFGRTDIEAIQEQNKTMQETADAILSRAALKNGRPMTNGNIQQPPPITPGGPPDIRQRRDMAGSTMREGVSGRQEAERNEKNLYHGSSGVNESHIGRGGVGVGGMEGVGAHEEPYEPYQSRNSSNYHTPAHAHDDRSDRRSNVDQYDRPHSGDGYENTPPRRSSNPFNPESDNYIPPNSLYRPGNPFTTAPSASTGSHSTVSVAGNPFRNSQEGAGNHNGNYYSQEGAPSQRSPYNSRRIDGEGDPYVEDRSNNMKASYDSSMARPRPRPARQQQSFGSGQY